MGSCTRSFIDAYTLTSHWRARWRKCGEAVNQDSLRALAVETGLLEGMDRPVLQCPGLSVDRHYRESLGGST
jgi:hypothetical protein